MITAVHPVILSIGVFSISSFGFFLSLAFLVGLFVIWRLCKLYDIDEEKTLDLSLLTFFGGLIGARVYFVLTNLSQFDSLSKAILFNRYPGMGFWGGLLGGALTLSLLTRRMKLSLWQIADFVIVGVFAALSLGSLGCLFSSCQSGLPSNLPIAVTQIGLLDRRFPIQLVEALIFFILYLYLWRICVRFHFTGKVLSVGLILLGIVKLVIEPFRADISYNIARLSLGQIFSVLTIASGFFLFYYLSKRSIVSNARFIANLATSQRERALALSRLNKNWYNLKVNTRVNLHKFYRRALGYKRILRKNLNVKPNPPEFQQR